MRKWCAFLAAGAVAACADTSPTASDDPSFGLVMRPVAASHAIHLTNAAEVPACPSGSKGFGTYRIYDNGQIEAASFITNRGGESVRFGHIHHLNPGAQTGPIIWWLTAPTGTDLNLTDANFSIHQLGVFVTNAHFRSNAAAVAELLANPKDFYVNFHSDNCPGGFARGFLGQ